jgi:hypothetical protein
VEVQPSVGLSCDRCLPPDDRRKATCRNDYTRRAS